MSYSSLRCKGDQLAGGVGEGGRKREGRGKQKGIEREREGEKEASSFLKLHLKVTPRPCIAIVSKPKV